MTGLEKIIETIIADGRAKEQAILDGARTYCDQELEETRLEASEILRQAREDAESQAKTIDIRFSSLAETNKRKQELANRQRLVDQIIDQALEKLNQQDKQAKVDLYVGLVRKNEIKSGTIALNADDQYLMKDLLAELGPDFSASDDLAAIRGGLLVYRGDVLENLSYDLVIKNYKYQLSAALADLLTT